MTKTEPRRYKDFRFLTDALCFALLLPSVFAISYSSAATQYPFTFRDSLEREIMLASVPKRLISIGPANTEILFAIDAGKQVAGVDGYSNYPQTAKQLTQVGSLVSPAFDTIVALNPDLVIVGTSISKEIVDRLAALGINAAAIAPENLNEIYKAIELLGQICDKSPQANQVVAQMKRRVKRVQEVVEPIPKAKRRSVFYELWHDPLRSAGPGSFIHELIELAGGVNIAGDAKTAWPHFSLEALVGRNPQVIFTTRRESLTELKEGHRKAWNGISAVGANRIYLLDADEISRPGPRVVQALEAIAQGLYPEQFEEKTGTGDKVIRSKIRNPQLLRRNRKPLRLSIYSVGAWFIIAILSLSLGAVRLPIRDILAMIGSRLPFLSDVLLDTLWWPASSEVILFQIRMPRVLLAGLVGASLALSGTTLQGLCRNPMASPFVLGISAGASLGAVCAFVLKIELSVLGLSSVPLMAFAGALGTTILVYNLARVKPLAKRDPATAGKHVPIATLLLSGIAVGSVLSALVSLTLVFGERHVAHIVFWLMGGLSRADWNRIGHVIPYFLIGFVVTVVYARDLNAMLLGEEASKHLGIDVERVKLYLLCATSLLTAAAVSVSGVIGFVGLIVPHIVRLIVGPDHRLLVPIAALAGAIFLTVMDTVARTVLSSTEIPVGAITALFGGPFFIFLLRRGRIPVF